MRAIANLRRHRRRAALGAAAATLALAAVPALGGRTLATAQTEAATASKTVTVNIRNFAFRPGNLTVARGTKVVFANRDSVRHTATKRGSFSTGRIKGGSSASVRFASSGTYRYHCLIHPEMRGKIVVP